MSFDKFETEYTLFNADTTPQGNGADGGNGEPNKEPDNQQQTDPNQSKDTKVEFTPEQQAKLDEIVKGRLADEKAKQKRIEEEAKLKAQGEYKELLEKRERELEELRNQVKAKEVETTREKLLREAGYSEKQLPFAKKNVSGENEDEIKAAIVELAEYYPAETTEQIGFPSTGNGSKTPPPKKDNYDAARERAKELLAKRPRR